MFHEKREENFTRSLSRARSSSSAVIFRFYLLSLQWLEWHPCAPVLLAGTDDGSVWMWKVPSGDCKTFQSGACQATTGKVLPDGKWTGRETVFRCFSQCTTGFTQIFLFNTEGHFIYVYFLKSRSLIYKA